MEKNSRKNQYMYYTDGNAARVAVPQRVEPERKIERREETHRRTYKNPKEGLTMNIPYVMFLFAAACAIVISCMQYINLNAEISNVTEAIASVENKSIALKAQNDAIEYEIDSSVDMDDIYATATEELGMVQVTEDTIRFYTSTEGEYMKQFSDVPTE